MDYKGLGLEEQKYIDGYFKGFVGFSELISKGKHRAIKVRDEVEVHKDFTGLCTLVFKDRDYGIKNSSGVVNYDVHWTDLQFKIDTYEKENK